jgi:hypothetical protein
MRAWVVYVLLDTLCVGLGMGVPVFCIALGLVVGVYWAGRLVDGTRNTRTLLSGLFRHAVVSSGYTFLLMLLLWGRTASMLWDPRADLANFGIPLILYDPTASFVGWLVLMILISPFLQMLMTVWGAHMAWLVLLPRTETDG